MKTEALLEFLNDWAAAIRIGKPIAITLEQADRLDEAIAIIVLLQAELAVRDRRKYTGDAPPPIGDRRFELRRKHDYPLPAPVPQDPYK